MTTAPQLQQYRRRRSARVSRSMLDCALMGAAYGFVAGLLLALGFCRQASGSTLPDELAVIMFTSRLASFGPGIISACGMLGGAIAVLWNQAVGGVE